MFMCVGFVVKVKGEQASSKDAPILVVAPHSTFFDALAVAVMGAPSVVAKAETKKCSFLRQPHQVHSATAGPPDRPGFSKENFGHNEREKCRKRRRGKMATGVNLPRGHLHKQECFDNISLGCLHSWSASPASHNTVRQLL